MKTSESQDKLVPALFAAKQKFPRIAKNKKGQSGNRTFQYAPLDVIQDHVDPVLYENSLMVTQGTEGHELVTRLEHVSGQWREIHMPVNDEHANMQSYGIEISYRRRYSYQLILGIVTEEDIDIKEKTKRAGKDHTEAQPERQRHGVAQDVLATSRPLSPTRKAKIEFIAKKVQDQFEAYGAQSAFERMDQEKLGDIELVYLSTLLPSNVRNPIKAYSIEFHNGGVPA